MKHIRLIMPMGGAGSRFVQNGVLMPKPLIDLHGKPFFYWATKAAVQCIEGSLESIWFVVLKDHVVHFGIDQVIKAWFPLAHIVVLDHVLPGPIHTALFAISSCANYDGPILFNDCDHVFISPEFASAVTKGSLPDIATLYFRSREKQFSYLKVDSDGRIIDVKEKEPISDMAICGAYYFGSPLLFQKMALEAAKKAHSLGREAFLSDALIESCKDLSLNVKAYFCSTHISFGTPEELVAARKAPYFHE